MNYTNKYKIPAEICLSIRLGEREHRDNCISVTQLIDSPKIHQYRLRSDSDNMTVDYSVYLNSFHGQNTHAVLEGLKNKDPNTISNKEVREWLIKFQSEHEFEHQMEYEFKEFGLTLTGRCDQFNKVTKILTDYKETKVWKLVFNPDGVKEWENQLNVYCWLLRQEGIEIKANRIVAMMKDWTQSKANTGGENYPNSQDVEFWVPVWDERQQYNYIIDRLKLHKAAMTKPIDELSCSLEEKWAKDDVYAVMKHGRKTAMKLFPNDKDGAILYSNNCSGTYIEKREGGFVRCSGSNGGAPYCIYSEICNKK